MHMTYLFSVNTFSCTFLKEQLVLLFANLIDESLELISVDQPDAGARIPDLRCLLTVPSIIRRNN